MLVIIEEAHEFLSAERIEKMRTLFEQVARIAKRGRKRWLGLAFVTQLPQHLPRQVFGLCNNYILHKITDPQVVQTLRQDGQRHRRGPVGPPAGPGPRPGHRVVPAHDPAAAGRDRPGGVRNCDWRTEPVSFAAGGGNRQRNCTDDRQSQLRGDP